MYLTTKQIRNHILTWIIILTYLNLHYSPKGTLLVKIIGGSVEGLNYMFVFYSICLFIFPKFWKSKPLKLSIGISLCLVLYFTNSYINYLIIIPNYGGKIYYQDLSILTFIAENIFYFFIASSAGIAFFFYQYSIFNLRIQTNKEKALLIQELTFLKTQFNSHITFNFLNYCYSKIHRQTNDVAESIELFSDMLRQALQTKPDEKIILANEIKYIENFIQLKKLLNPNIYVNFSYNDETKNTSVFPRILFTFVEKAFKHGISSDPLYTIEINLKANNHNLIFFIQNKYIPKKETNDIPEPHYKATQLLDLYYPNNYELKKENTNGVFTITLYITKEAIG